MPYGYAIPGIWVYAASQFNTGQVYPAFLTSQQQARMERIRQARLIFDGKHRQYFFEEERTQFDFPPKIAGYRVMNPYLKYNALGLISWKGTDLILGAAPVVKVKKPAQQKALEQLLERSSIRSMFYDAGVTCTYEAEAFIEACVSDGEVYCKVLDGAEMFPIGEMLPGGQYREYLRCRLKNLGTDQVPIPVVLEEHYLPGKITRQLWQLNDSGEKLAQLNLINWPVDEGQPPLAPQINTGIALNTVTWVPNQLSRGKVVSDYDIALDLQDALNAKQTQLAMLIASHADPTMILPSRMADDEGNLRANNKALFIDDAGENVRYLVWDAQSHAALADRDFALHNLLISTETSPVLLGLKEGAHNDAYKKVKVQSMSSLTKGQRKGVYWQIGIKRVLTVAQMLEQTIPGMRYDIEPIGVSLRDGIPLDELDQANQLAILKAAGLLSEKRGVETLIEDPAAAAEELGQLKAENMAKAPTILLGKPARGAGPGAQETEQQVEGEAAAGEAAELEEVAA